MKVRIYGSWLKFVTICILLNYIFYLTIDFVGSCFAQESTSSYSDILLQNGDAVRFIVWEGWHSPSDKSLLSSFNGEFVIDGSGMIRLPAIGPFKIAGKKNSQIESELLEQLAPFAKNPSISCIPLIKIALLGAFNRPGIYRIKADATFWELTEKGSGPDNTIDFKKSIVKRADKVIIKNLLQSFEKGQSILEMGIQSGDQVIFAERSKLTFDKVIRYVNFGVSMVMLAFTIDNYRTNRRY